MKHVVLAVPGNDNRARSLAAALGAGLATARVHEFPDGESKLTLDGPIAGADVVACCTLDRPDAKLVRLVLAARGARELGAGRVGLVAPYLAYMRQDRAFQAGEVVSCRHVAWMLSGVVDWLVTADPHLHRMTSLGEVFTIPAVAVTTTRPLAAWIRENVDAPVIVGPDGESEQWARRVASLLGAPCVVLTKERRGDRDVVVHVPSAAEWRGRTPVLVDDIASTARTLTTAVRQLVQAGSKPPVCVVVHAILTDGAQDAVRAAGAARLVSSDSIPHATNAFSIAAPLTEAVRRLLEQGGDQDGG